ncbi:putative uncharacterized protein [Wolbachia endosymbiont of Cimex lectularius]|nr:putative uncharacterized protein [Wolbachia endosymbiont of Cimex lectularius]
MRHSLSLSDLSISENTLVSQLQNELLRANTAIETSYRQLSRLYNNNTDLSEQLKKAGELNNVLLEHLEDQVQQLTQLFQEENEEQEIAELAQKLGTIDESLRNGICLETLKELNRLYKKREEIRNKLNGNALFEELIGKKEQIKELSTQVEKLQQQLEAQDAKITELKLQPSNAEVSKLKADLKAKDEGINKLNSQVQQLEKEKKELEAKKQPTEQSKAPTYTAAFGFGLAAGLAAFIALERTVRLDIWTMVGIALASALAVSGGTYLALKPSTQMNEAETKGVNKEEASSKKQPV